MVVAWRIAHRPEPRAAVLVSIQQIRQNAIFGDSKDFRLDVTLKPREIDGCCRTTKVEVWSMTNPRVLFRMVCSVSGWDYVQSLLRGCN